MMKNFGLQEKNYFQTDNLFAAILNIVLIISTVIYVIEPMGLVMNIALSLAAACRVVLRDSLLVRKLNALENSQNIKYLIVKDPEYITADAVDTFQKIGI